MKKRTSKMVEFRNRFHIEQSGTLRQILAHPINESEAIELALFSGTYLQEGLLKSSETSVFFDIDLDYFSVKNGLSDGSFEFTYLQEKEIRILLDKDNLLIHWILERIKGITIATEPEHCGGLLQSNKFLNLISETYFSPELFAPKCNWKWKPKY